MKNTNVKEIVFAEGAVNNAAKDFPRFAVVSMDVPWSLVADKIGAKPEAVFLIEDVMESTVNRVIEQMPDVESIVGIGGGQALDVAKYSAYRLGKSLISIPTIVSTNTYVTPSAGIRKGTGVEYIGDIRHDLVIVDYDVIRSAPKHLNLVGAGDILSIHTGSRDWEIAAAAGARAEARSFPFRPDCVERARGVLKAVQDNADSIHKVSNEGIRLVVESFLEINDICIPAGNFRSEEGSEHFFAYNVERVTKKKFLHGGLVALGIFVMSKFQENDHESITATIEQIGIPYTPQDNGITKDELTKSLDTLKSNTIEQNYWYSIIDEKEMTQEFIAGIVDHFFA